MSAIFPDCRQNLNWLIRRFFVEEAQPRAGGDSPALAVLDYVLLTARAWDVEPQKIPALFTSISMFSFFNRNVCKC